MSDKMREAIVDAYRCGVAHGKSYPDLTGEKLEMAAGGYLCRPEVMAALSQQPESEPVGKWFGGHFYKREGVEIADMTTLYAGYQAPGRAPDEVLQSMERLYSSQFNRWDASDSYVCGNVNTADVVRVVSWARSIAFAAPSIAAKREWIRCDERLPTEADGDISEEVWVYGDGGDGRVDRWIVENYLYYFEAVKPIGEFWMPTGLTRPAPPEEVQ